MRRARDPEHLLKRRQAIAPLLLFLAVLGAYLANGRTIGAGDTLPARYLPWSLLRDHTLTLDAFPSLHDETASRIFPILDGVPYYLRYRDGHYHSAYTPGPGVLATPVYAVPILLGAPPDGAWPASLEKLAAAAITALSVVVLYLALEQLVSRRWALGIALIYAFGTSSLSVSSQALWQHGPSQLFLSLLVYWLVRGQREKQYLACAGFAMAAACTMRQTDVVLVLPVAAWIVASHPALAPRLLLWAAVPVAGLALYNLSAFGALSGGSGQTSVPLWALFSQTPLREGLPGALFSPSRGLFVYSPVFLFSVLGCLCVWRRGGPWAFRALSLGLPLLVTVVSTWFLWWGGHTWGPRLLADAAPILSFFLYPLVPLLSRRPLLKGLFVVSALFSIATHALGAFCYDGRWDGGADVERHEARLWSWTEGPLAFYGRELLARGHAVIVPPGASREPTSRDSPDQLAASYRTTPIPPEVLTGEPMPVSVEVKNTGRAVWLASTPGERGMVRLGWQWTRGERAEGGGRTPLPADVSPGQEIGLTARITAPEVPGDHILTLGMVSELVTWFADRGSKPITVAVRVLPMNVDRLVSSPEPSGDDAPGLSISSDRPIYRPGDQIGLTVTLDAPHRPRRYDAYLVLKGESAAFVYDGRRVSPSSRSPWPAWVRELPLPARAIGRFSVSSEGLAPGSYRWYVVLTAPGTYDAEARASTPLRIEP